ncbi:hypothetical protein ACLMJK_009353 [Lecanora helva]
MSPLISTNESDASAKLREWSSLIGIVTAIVGNILISFALNIQRYAHIRLGQEQEEVNGRGHTKTKQKSYGTQQSEIAEERAQYNLSAPTNGERDGNTFNNSVKNGGEVLDHGSILSNSSSDSTVKQTEKSERLEDRKSYLRSPYWWAGIVLMTCGEAGNFIAYGFAPASIVSPLGVVALVSNCIIAPVLLKERFRLRDFCGVTIAIAGAVTIVLSAKNSENKMGPDDVWAAITRWEFETYLGITAALIIALMWASGRYGEKTILIDLGLVGLFGGYTALSTKGVASLLSDTLWRVLTFPISYLLVFILVATALLQIRYVNRALQRFDSTQVIPVQFVLFTISVIIGSAVLYRDFQSADASRFAKFFGGCALTFIGVYLITSRRPHGGNQDHSMGEEEGIIGMIDEERYQDEVDEEEQSERRLSANFALDRSTHLKDSLQNEGSKSPQTPPPLLSYTPTTSSRLSSTESPLLENPWSSSQERPRALGNTTSSPLLPSEAQRAGAPFTPQISRVERRSFSKGGRPSALSRQSMARLTPGPLSSPLSSSLTAVVADKRRGLDSPSTRARPSPGVRQSRSQRGTQSSTGGDLPTLTPSRTAHPSRTSSEVAVEEDSPLAGRSQSVSATLGDFFRLKRERSNGKAVDRDTNDTPK